MAELLKIISGGQSGADLAALDAAIFLGIPHGGWLPRGRKTERGPLPARYRLSELDSGKYRDRTRKNILDSDGTLIIANAPLSGGSALTEALTIRYDRPCLIVNLSVIEKNRAVGLICKWINDNRIRVLNVAGPRASGDPDIYRDVFALLVLKPWNNEGV